MKNSHIFSQILQHIRWEAFENIVQKYSGDHAAKGISCHSPFITMLFAYISGADSLREIRMLERTETPFQLRSGLL